MKIQAKTEMLLFRYNNYKKTAFIDEHRAVMKENGYVWMLKVGKRSSLEKLQEIKEKGGWMALRSPKADGSKTYFARFTEVSEETPSDMTFPEYYDEILTENQVFTEGYAPVTHQWFKIEFMSEAENEAAEQLVLSKTLKPVDEVITTTRTAVMFIHNVKALSL